MLLVVSVDADSSVEGQAGYVELSAGHTRGTGGKPSRDPGDRDSAIAIATYAGPLPGTAPLEEQMRAAEADAIREARRAMRDRAKAVRGAEAAAVRGAKRSLRQRKRMLGETINTVEGAAIRQAKAQARRGRKSASSEPYSASYNLSLIHI